MAETHNVELIFEDTADDTRIYECTTCWELWTIVGPPQEDNDFCLNEEEADGNTTEASPGGSPGQAEERDGVVGWRGYGKDGNGPRLLLD